MASKAFIAILFVNVWQLAPWWLFALMAVPFLWVGPWLFIRIELAILSIPISLLMHEMLHALPLPAKTRYTIIRTPFCLALTLNEPLPTPGRALLSACLPGLLLPAFGLWLMRYHVLIALPWLLHFISLPFDCFEWYRMTLWRKQES